MTIELNGKAYETDEEGYLENLNEWNSDLAEIMAKEDGCDMNENHWEVVNFLREYYDEYQIAPAVRVLTKAIGKRLGKDDHIVNWPKPTMRNIDRETYKAMPE